MIAWEDAIIALSIHGSSEALKFKLHILTTGLFGYTFKKKKKTNNNNNNNNNNKWVFQMQ